MSNGQPRGQIIISLARTPRPLWLLLRLERWLHQPVVCDARAWRRGPAGQRRAAASGEPRASGNGAGGPTQPALSRGPASSPGEKREEVSHCIRGACRERQSVLLNSHFLRYLFSFVIYLFYFFYIPSGFQTTPPPTPLLLLLRVAFPPSNPTIKTQPIWLGAQARFLWELDSFVSQRLSSLPSRWLR